MHVAAATRESLMGDKIVALAMRPYVKLRDFYDVWWLWHELGGRCDPAWVEASARLYGLTLQDVAQGLARLDTETPTVEALQRDLRRWLPQHRWDAYSAAGVFEDIRARVMEVAHSVRDAVRS